VSEATCNGKFLTSDSGDCLEKCEKDYDDCLREGNPEPKCAIRLSNCQLKCPILKSGINGVPSPDLPAPTTGPSPKPSKYGQVVEVCGIQAYFGWFAHRFIESKACQASDGRTGFGVWEHIDLRDAPVGAIHAICNVKQVPSDGWDVVSFGPPTESCMGGRLVTIRKVKTIDPPLHP
jgi:hypothetical protein